MRKELKLTWHHTLTEAHKSHRVPICEEMQVHFASRLTQSNLVTIDEKFFSCRHLAPHHKIGNWLSEVTAQGDEPIRHTARRTTMEKSLL